MVIDISGMPIQISCWTLSNQEVVQCNNLRRIFVVVDKTLWHDCTATRKVIIVTTLSDVLSSRKFYRHSQDGALHTCRKEQDDRMAIKLDHMRGASLIDRRLACAHLWQMTMNVK